MGSAIIYFVLALSSATAFAGPPTVAFEFNHSTIGIYYATDGTPYTPLSEAAQNRMVEKVRLRCPGCPILVSPGQYVQTKDYKVLLPDGWWFEITLDPGVVETKTKFETLQYLRDHKTEIQRLIFGGAGAARLRPSLTPETRSLVMQMNFGMFETFGDDPLLFRNFLVDFVNHPSVNYYIHPWCGETCRPMLEQLSEPQKQAFKKLIDEYDYKAGSLRDFVKQLVDKVFYTNPGGWAPAAKFQAVNVSSVDDLSTWFRMELTMFMPNEFEDALTMSEMILGRIEYLKTIKRKIPYIPQEKTVDDFYRYTSKTGVEWNRISKVMQEIPYIGELFGDYRPSRKACRSRLSQVP